jgi:hypothetical protein
MPELIYPDSTELMEIEQDLIPVMEDDDPVFFGKLFPVSNADTYKLEWEQLDNFSGLQQARGLDGQPSRVARVGSNRFSTEPGVYGEFLQIDEQELTKRAEIAKFTGTIDVTDLVATAQRQLLQRRIDRQRFLGWTLLSTGAFNVAAPNGGYEHRDRYAFDTITASPGFTNLATATPFQFFQALMLQGRGTSSAFDSSATCYVNQVTANRIIGNTNANDLGGRFRIGGGNTINSLEEINTVLQARGLPKIEVYDKGYNTTINRSSFVPFIADGIGVLIGKRSSNAPLGGYRMTLNVHNGFKPGPYAMVKNTYGDDAPGKATCEVHDGHNGGPYITFPSMVKILNLG